jgi:hypothetical protein
MKIRSRCHQEGLSFLTKTLPTLGKAFDKALQGNVAFAPIGFRKDSNRTTPKLFGWLFKRVFDDKGYILASADIHAIQHIRQIFQLLYKLEVKHDYESTEKVLSSFRAVNMELQELHIDQSDQVIKRARAFITRALSGLPSRDISPAHGPGAVATGEKGGRKSIFSRLYKDMESWYPFTEYFHVSLSHTVDCLHQLEALEELDTGTAKVVLVPKDSRGPRLISCEPLEKQWIQQGQRKLLYTHIESHPLTRGHVNFTDQEINRSLALASSQTQHKVTLDMKEASDRVSLKLIQALFSGTEWLQALLASRSGYTRMPDKTVVRLETFAPMGSAVCFPIEALVFYSLAVSALVTHKVYAPSISAREKWAKARDSVYVYGDDIICDTEDYGIIMQQLERFGLLFNRSKCCVSGFFRESCGCDAYKGVDVTPIRLKKTWSHRARYNVVQLQSYVEFRNSMFDRGYYGVASYVQELVEDLYGPIPFLEYTVVPSKSYCHIDKKMKVSIAPKRKRVPPGRVIGFDASGNNPQQLNKGRCAQRFNRHTHRLEVRGYSNTPRLDVFESLGWEMLLRSLQNGATGFKNGVYAIPRSSRMKRTWGLVK